MVTDSQISILTLLVIVCAGLGALFWGWLSDKIGSIRTLTINLITWIAIISAIAWAGNYQAYFIFALVTGLCIGGTMSTSRRVLIELVPKQTLNYAFGWYAISERASTIIGPLAWSAVLVIGGYRWAMFSMVVFQIMAVILIFKVSRKVSMVDQPLKSI